MKPGELCSLSELFPQDCKLFNSPCLSGHSGGLVMLFKNTFHCLSLPTGSYHSFEVQLFQIVMVNPVIIVLVYRLPQQNKDFLTEFAAFVGDLITAHDKTLLLGDFNNVLLNYFP